MSHATNRSQGPAIHPHLAALAAPPPPDQNRAAGGIEIALGQSKGPTIGASQRNRAMGLTP
jgi:hypothetical protein